VSIGSSLKIKELDVTAEAEVESQSKYWIHQNFDEREISMDKLLEQSLHTLLAREGLEPRAGDLQEFARIIELYVETLKTLHSVNLDAEEVAGVFRPEWVGK